jgi:hypothetical protein
MPDEEAAKAPVEEGGAPTTGVSFTFEELSGVAAAGALVVSAAAAVGSVSFTFCEPGRRSR